MSVNKTSDTRESSVAPKSDLEDSQQKEVDNNRRNAGGYSWWKWRRSTDSQDKKSPPKELDNKESRQSVERIDEVINDLEHLNLDVTKDADTSPIDDSIEPQLLESMQNLSVDNTDSAAKNDDSISSELADVSKCSFTNEKYRKTLRLTSEQIVSEFIFFFIKKIEIKSSFFCFDIV